MKNVVLLFNNKLFFQDEINQKEEIQNILLKNNI